MKVPGKIIAVLMTETRENTGKTAAPAAIEEMHSGPAYVATMPDQKMIGEPITDIIEGTEVTFHIKGYPQNIIFVEGAAETEDLFRWETLDLKEKMLQAAREILKRHDTYKDFEEEYGIFCVSRYVGVPEQVFAEYQEYVASFVKSEREPLDEKEISQTLGASIKYGKDDLLIVDWDGAFVFDSSGHFDETIELLELGNYQLLNYRVLDFELDRRLDKLSRLLAKQQTTKIKIFRAGDMKETVRKFIQARSRSIITFEAVDRNVKLIGDWYSARVFNLIEKKFHLEVWRHNIKDKFETLEDIYNMASENFELSFSKRMDIAMMFGWLILLIGWFVLLVLDFAAYFK